MIQRDKLTELVAGVQRGSEQAVTEMYQACHQELYYYIYKTVNHTELAEDLTQETFMEILQSIHTLQEPAAFVTWSRQIAYRRCTAYFKKRHDFLLDEQEDGSTVLDTLEEERTEFIPGEALDQEELKQMIQDMIQALPEEQRTAIMMRYFDELSVGEIAAVQGVSEGTVKSRLNYGRKAIGQAVQDYEKKNGVKLHCVGVVPLLLWLLRKQCLAKGTIGTAATATTATTAAATVGSTLLSAKLSAVVASLVAAAVGIGGMLYAVRTTQNPEESNTLLQTEQPQFPHTPDPIFITAADARIFDAITEETYASMAADLIGLQQYGEESMTCTPVGALYYYNETLQEERQDNRLVILFHLENALVPGGWYTYMSPNDEVVVKAVQGDDGFSHHSVVCASEFNTRNSIDLLYLYYSREEYSFWLDTKYPIHFDYGDRIYSGHRTIEDCLVALEENLIEGQFEHVIYSDEEIKP